MVSLFEAALTVSTASAYTVTYSLGNSDPLPPSNPNALVPEGGIVHISSSSVLNATAWDETDTCDPSSIRRAYYSVGIRIEMTASPAEITDGTGEESEIKAIVTDLETSQPVVDEPVTFHTTIGQFANETTEQTVNTDEDGAATVTFSQGTASAGQTAYITASLTGLPPGAQVRVPILYAIPEGVTATGVGSGKIAIYWDVCNDATDYEVYRGIMAGGNKTILTGTAQQSFDGSDKMVFIDQTVVDDTTYYYSVKAVYSDGVSKASDEDSAVTNSYAIPWDTRNATAIVQAAELRTSVSADAFIVVGPDGTSYVSGSDPLPLWPFDLGPIPLTPAGEEELGEEELGLGALNYDPTKDKNNANSGPYRKSESKCGYRKITALAILPTAVNTTVSAHSFPGGQRIRRGKVVECSDSGDFPYMYLGGTGWVTQGNKKIGKYPLDMGLRYEPADGNWNVFFLKPAQKGEKWPTFWVYDPDKSPLYEQFKDTIPDLTEPPTLAEWVNFAPGQTVTMQCWCTDNQVNNKPVEHGVSLRVTGIDRNTSTTKTMQVFAEQEGFAESGQDVSLKWVTSIGQYFPTLGAYKNKNDYNRGFVQSGSFIKGAGWDSVQVYDMTRSWFLSYSDGIAQYQKTFPAEPAIVTRHGTSWPYYREFDLWVDLTVNQ